MWTGREYLGVSWGKDSEDDQVELSWGWLWEGLGDVVSIDLSVQASSTTVFLILLVTFRGVELLRFFAAAQPISLPPMPPSPSYASLSFPYLSLSLMPPSPSHAAIPPSLQVPKILAAPLNYL